MPDVPRRRALTSVVTRLAIARQLIAELHRHGLAWLSPLVLLLLLFGAVLALLSGAEVIAPFLYPLL